MAKYSYIVAFSLLAAGMFYNPVYADRTGAEQAEDVLEEGQFPAAGPQGEYLNPYQQQDLERVEEAPGPLEQDSRTERKLFNRDSM